MILFLIDSLQGPFLEVYSFGREIMQYRQYYIASGITFWKCTPLLRTPFFAYTQIWHSWKCTQ